MALPRDSDAAEIDEFGVRYDPKTRTSYHPRLESMSEDLAIRYLEEVHGVPNETAWLWVGIAHGKITGDAREVSDEELAREAAQEPAES